MTKRKSSRPRKSYAAGQDMKKLKRELALSVKENLSSRIELAEQKETLDLTQLELDLYKEIAKLTRTGYGLERLLDRVMEKVLKITGTEAGTLFMLDESGDNLVFSVVKGAKAKELVGQKISLDEGIAGWVARTGLPHLSSRPSKDTRWSRRFDKSLGFKTRDLLAVPIQSGEEAVGVIELLNKCDGRPFDKKDLELLSTISSQVAMLIENAQLFLRTKEKVDQFATLTDLSRILNSSLDPKEVHTRAMEAVVRLLDCEAGSLYLIDEERQELYFEVALGDKADKVKEIRLKIGEGIAGWVAKEGRSDLVPDCSKDPRWAKRVDRKSKWQTRNMVTVPVKARDKVIGVLQALNKKNDGLFNEEDLMLMESLADQVAIALENARLYEDQKQTFLETAQALAAAIEKRDIYTGGHTKRVRDFCMVCAKFLDLDDQEKEWLELSAILHDIGKIGIDDRILRKPGKLTDDEFEQIRSHPTFGFEIMNHIKSLGEVIPGMRFHHERPDGKGYPNGLKDGKIPFLARIIAVADTWDAMTSDRPYRPALSDSKALEELKKNAGTQFDEKVVKAFIKAYKKGLISSQNKNNKAGN